MGKSETTTHELNRALTAPKLWGIIVAAVVSGMYFGWNYAFAKTNFIGVVIATLIVTIFYVTFVLCYSELATAIPSSGGPSAYAEKAFGRFGGYIAGFSILVEYLFATPGIAISIGAYVHMLIPAVPTTIAALVVYLIFVYINCRGIQSAAIVAMVVTALAIVGVVVFIVAGLPTFSAGTLLPKSSSMNGFMGIFAAIPYAVWFYLAVESGAMGAEECKNPKKDIPKAFIGAILSLVLMAVGTLLITAGNASPDSIVSTDSPLPFVLAGHYGEASIIVKVVSFLGLFGLVASLHGIIIAYSRQAFTMARSNFLPSVLSKLDKKGTPVVSLIITSAIGILLVLPGSVAALVVISCIGSTVMAIMSLIAFFVIRKKDPALERPYRVNNKIVPIVAIVSCVVVAVAIIVSQGVLTLAAVAAYAVAAIFYVVYQAFIKKRLASTVPEEA